ncbi:MAG: D-alanyl-D-alanine carboxypeptidase [Hydrogenophilaceae bacterium]|jgi:D-alanyl-D-alanine carboxypeptidase|nr:D-alanyl-D-alanine carboxypeptidase [Hydrogenophilaceae bacterium]
MTHLGRRTAAVSGARRAAVFGAALVVIAASSPAFAQTNDRYAAIVIDVETNEVLHADQADEQRYPASLTKMMTLYMLFEAMERGEIGLEDRLTASRFASRQPPSRLGVRRGDTLTVEQAINALVVQSANDVAVMVAERLAGSEAAFAEQMTRRARQLGMEHTRFMNASGLPNPRIRTTARDMATLSIAIWRDFPQYYHVFQTPSNSWRGREARNHNRLLGAVEGVDGIKTGYTRASGFNLATAAVRDGRRVVAVVMGGSSAAARDAQVAYLIEGAYEELARREVLGTDVAMTSRPVQSVTATFEADGAVVARPGDSSVIQLSGPVGPLRGPLDRRMTSYAAQGDVDPMAMEEQAADSAEVEPDQGE